MHETMTATVLSSGSCGNSIFVSSEDAGVLIDAGLSCKETERRMSSFGFDPAMVKAIILTHEHTDHTRGVQRFCTKYEVPVYGTDGTLSLTPLDGIRMVSISSKDSVHVDRFMFRPFPIKHFAAEPVAFTVSIGSKKVAIASDLGSVTTRIVDEMKDSDLVLIESNYDDDMLMHGAYPDFLKRTIRSDHGHLSNEDAGLLASEAASERTRSVVLLHLSKENNTPDKARETVGGRLMRSHRHVRLEVTEHGGSNGPFRLG